MRNTAFTLVALIALVGAGEASAQTDSETMTARINIPTLISIDVSNTDVSFPAPTLANYTSPGYVPSTGTTVISTRSNIVHKVTISTAETNMTGGSDNKPSSHLQWSTGGTGGTFVGVSGTAADVVTGLTRGVHASAAEVWYRMVLDQAIDEAVEYTLDFTYTALAN